ncbi:MAG: hypothetical protein J6X77_02180 [Bacteroidales bacterium]|nr:hypothetical protein [Bacteroidales bacterium]
MKRIKILVASFVLLVAPQACVEHGTYTPEFLTDATLRMAVGKNDIITYNPLTCQYAWNSDNLEFRLHTDNMSDYFILRLQAEPTEEEQLVTAGLLRWTSPTGADEVRKNIVLEVVKIEDDVIWLWYSRESIKMTVRFR